MTVTNDKWEEAGRQARRAGTPYTGNPWNRLSRGRPHRAWANGWMAEEAALCAAAWAEEQEKVTDTPS